MRVHCNLRGCGTSRWGEAIRLPFPFQPASSRSSGTNGWRRAVQFTENQRFSPEILAYGRHIGGIRAATLLVVRRTARYFFGYQLKVSRPIGCNKERRVSRPLLHHGGDHAPLPRGGVLMAVASRACGADGFARQDR